MRVDNAPMASIHFTLRERCTGGEVPVEITDDLQHEDDVHIATYAERSARWKYLPRWLKPADLDRAWNWTLVTTRRTREKKSLPISIWVLRPTTTIDFGLRTFGVVILQEGNSPADGADLMHVNLLGVHPRCRSMGFSLLRRPGVVRGVAVALLKFASDRAKTLGGSGTIGLDAVGRSKALYARIGLARRSQGDKADGTLYCEGVIK